MFVSPQGQFKPCCRFKMAESIDGTHFSQIFLGERWSKIRHQMSLDQPVEGCQRCYQEEEAGKKSLRQRYNQLPDIGLQASNLDDPQILWLEIPFSNRCNLACRMCDSRYSTRWIQDEKKWLGHTLGSERVLEFDWESFETIVDSLKHVKVTGGEPLMDPNHKRFLRLLGQKGKPQQVYLNYSTNLTLFPDEEVLESWASFQRVELALSLDSCFENELHYIRYPTDGSKALGNLARFMKLVNKMDNLTLILRSTVSLLNIYSMPETLLYWNQLKSELVEKDCQDRVIENPTHLTYPEYLAPNVLPPQKRLKVVEHFKSFENHSDTELAKHLPYLQSIMEGEDGSHLYPKFLEMTQKLDKIRDQDFRKVFPFLAH